VLLSSGTGTGQIVLVNGQVTVGTYTGNTPQTGDAYARIGATGSALTSLAPASTALTNATWTDAKAGYIDAAVSSRSTYAGGAVASVTGSVGSVDNFGTLVADTATAVWEAATRVLTAGTNIVLAKGTGVTGFNDIAAGTAMTLTSAYDAAKTSAPSAAIVAGAVWDVTLASHLIAGSTGYFLNACGAEGDPWAIQLNEYNVPGTAGYIINQEGSDIGLIRAKTDLLGTSTVVVASPVATSGDITIIVGDDYLAVDGRALSWTGKNWPFLTGGSVIVAINGKSYIATITTSSRVQLELTRAQTSAMVAGLSKFAIIATLPNGDVATLVNGKCTITPPTG
jgi:hypothetical protein